MNIDGFAHLYARVSDLSKKAERGETGISDFLTPREQHYAEIYLKKFHPSVRFAFFGGYADAERKRLYFLPDYFEVFDERALFNGGINHEIVCLLISGSGYRELSHRDYLGSVLGLGTRREAVGDILLHNDKSFRAYIFTTEKIANFLIAELFFVANDKVSAQKSVLPDHFVPQKRTLEIHDTVPSARLDCVIAALCNISRDKAKTAVESGIVECDFECITRPDKQLLPPCIISVRGYGRFKINSVSGVTKKGRIRLSAEKFI